MFVPVEIQIILENCLYAVVYDEIQDEFENHEFEEPAEHRDEFHRIFGNWYDPEYLMAFFRKHEQDLDKDLFDHISVEEAAERTIIEAHDLEEKIFYVAEQGKKQSTETLQTLFRPLNSGEAGRYPPPSYQKSKIYGNRKNSWLRIYAIRLEPNLFIVTGGAIKLVGKMQERAHLMLELKKMERVKRFLIEKGIIDNDSLTEYIEMGI